jgi:hypothetical protein
MTASVTMAISSFCCLDNVLRVKNNLWSMGMVVSRLFEFQDVLSEISYFPTSHLIAYS